MVPPPDGRKDYAIGIIEPSDRIEYSLRINKPGNNWCGGSSSHELNDLFELARKN
jgi:hypothetical protein